MGALDLAAVHVSSLDVAWSAQVDVFQRGQAREQLRAAVMFASSPGLHLEALALAVILYSPRAQHRVEIRVE